MSPRPVGRGVIRQSPEVTQVLTEWGGAIYYTLGEDFLWQLMITLKANIILSEHKPPT